MIYWIDPLQDTRWAEFVERHPDSSVFHTPEWLSALKRTYGFEPAAITSSAPGGPLADGIPFCRVRSILTGNRLVSLPFSDHCQPLASADELPRLLAAVRETVDSDHLKYAELRPLTESVVTPFSCSQKFTIHMLDLRPSLEDISRRLHPDCIRRKIRRADRENLTSEAGRSDVLLDDFYTMQVITRKRHGLPPQPRRWFRNLLDAMGDKATIRVARFRGRMVSAILTLRHKQKLVYKYGGSRVEDNRLGGMQLLLWKTIEDAKTAGMQEMDLGREALEAVGLAKFKERWGATRRELDYYRYPLSKPLKVYHPLLRGLPKPALIAAGRLLYRHMA